MIALSNKEKQSNPSGATNNLYSKATAMCVRATDFFPVYIVGGATLALLWPRSVVWFSGRLFDLSFQLSMAIMGLTLSLPQLSSALTSPRAVVLGCILQYSVMPICGLIVSMLLFHNPSLAQGVMLVSCCPGGAASNLVALLAGADVALSVVMTTASTVLASVLTPLLFKLLAGTIVQVSATDLIVSTSKRVLLPLALGVAFRLFAPSTCKAITPFCPLVAVITVSLVCASVIGNNSAAISSTGLLLPLCCVLLHSAGFVAAYILSQLLGLPTSRQRTVTIEVGVQNSALGVLLAYASPQLPNEAALPCAISACVHTTLGSTLAAFWRHLDRREQRLSTA